MTSIRFLGAAGTVTGSRSLVHGEPSALAAAASRLDTMGWANKVPSHLEEVSLQ